MNPFEAGSRKVIPAVLIYVFSADNRVLMIHRLGGVNGQGKAGDHHAGKWNGLGGKLELDESPWQAAQRELKEEAGLELPINSFQILGTLQFPKFKAHKNEDWSVSVLIARIDRPSAAIKLGHCAEGELHWIPENELLSLSLWAGDRYFIPFVREQRPFFGTIWYQGDVVLNYQLQTASPKKVGISSRSATID